MYNNGYKNAVIDFKVLRSPWEVCGANSDNIKSISLFSVLFPLD